MTMDDENKKQSLPENAATNYGMEDHEATAQDPRVHELRQAAKPTAIKTAESHRALRKSVDIQPRKNHEQGTEGNRDSAKSHVANVATSYGLEDHKADKEDPRVIQLRNPANVKDKNVVLLNPPDAANDTAINNSPATDPVSSRGSPPPAPPPPPLSLVRLQEGNHLSKETKQDEKKSVNRYTNTDVSFDPSKEYATKTTNTFGPLYTDTEDTPMPTNAKPSQQSLLNMDECFLFAIDLVKKAGAFALMANKEKDQVTYTTKKHEHDLHTRTDNEVEEMIVQGIADKYPNHKTIAEEAVSQSETGQVTLTNDPTWIIDPIDGTMNFVHRFPYYCISVALLVKKETVFGIVYNPPLEELYTARKGEGAQLNGHPMHTSRQDSLRKAMILQEYSSGMNDTRTVVAMENAHKLIKKTHALRSIGSSAMGLAMVASGVADGFYFFGLHVWDMAAGNLLVTEAGGTVLDPSGGEVDIMSRRVLAAASYALALHLVAELTQNYPSPRDDEPRSVNPQEFTKQGPTRDFNAQTDFSNSSDSVSSDASKHSQYHDVEQNK